MSEQECGMLMRANQRRNEIHSLDSMRQRRLISVFFWCITKKWSLYFRNPFVFLTKGKNYVMGWEKLFFRHIFIIQYFHTKEL